MPRDPDRHRPSVGGRGSALDRAPHHPNLTRPAPAAHVAEELPATGLSRTST